MNPRSSRQKVTSGVISRLGGNDKFHFAIILEMWFKINIKEIFASDVPLMWENAMAKQFKVGDIKGGNAIWDQKFLKLATA